MRGSRAVLLLTAGLLLFAMPFFGMCALVGGFDLGRDAEHDAALAEYWRGHAEFDAGHFLAAIPHYDVYRQFLRRHDGDDSEVTGSIAECLWRGGRMAEGLREFDASLARNLRWYVCVRKAHCLAQQDPLAALRWLQSQPLAPADRDRAVADFHRQRGEFQAAGAALQSLLEQLDGERCFDAENRLVDFPLPLPNERHNELAGLLDPLTELAECRFGLGQFDLAERTARRGVAVGQRICESFGYYEGEEELAGSVPCRLVLARIAMERQVWPEAEEHVRLARLLADRGSYSGHQQAAREVAAELLRRRGR